MKLKSPSFFAPTLCISLIQATGLDPINNFCRLVYHQSQVKNGVLYIDGGIASFSDRVPSDSGSSNDDFSYTGPMVLGTNDYIIVVNMSVSWDLKTNISEVAINKIVALGTSNPVPIVQSGALFHGMLDDPQVYLYGGMTPDSNTSFVDWQAPTTSQYALWGFDTQTHEWTQYDVVLNAPERPSWGASAEAPELGLAFYLNGLISDASSFVEQTADVPPTGLEGMVVLDLQNHTATNRSTDTISDGNPRVRGGMVYISQIGNMGVLISLGGATSANNSISPVSMSQVNIFDVESITQPNTPSSNNGWYTQTIIGEDVPSPRVDFCVIVVSAPDNSSFSIYLYGENVGYDDSWVLSIPSFSWIKLYQGSYPRYGHTCHLVGNSQMVTVGGANNPNVTETCDFEYAGIGILDLFTINWITTFDKEMPPYRINSKISAVIGGGPDGGATKLEPTGGWSSTQIAKLFHAGTNQTAPLSNGSTGSDNSDNSGSQTNVGAIAGGAVGGIVGGVALIGSIVLFFRWKRHPGGDKPAETGQTRFDKPELPGTSKPLPRELGQDAHQYLPELQGSTAELEGNLISELPQNQPAAELDGGRSVSEKIRTL
ncbi:hypothetical protein F5B20DRAFT_569830 [Whalleya microplaca]|nr:hypothetical protein F5B20DRAFT_569830 [Whalleya microplaca]